MNEKDYKRLEMMFSSGEWFMLPRFLLHKTKPVDAVMLSYLITLSRKFAHEHNGGWFYCTVARAEDQIGLNDEAQRRSTSRLKAANLLQAKLRGVPPRRYFRINFEVLGLLADEAREEADERKREREKRLSDVQKTPEIDTQKPPESNAGKTPELNLGKTPESNAGEIGGEIDNKANKEKGNRKKEVYGSPPKTGDSYDSGFSSDGKKVKPAGRKKRTNHKLSEFDLRLGATLRSIRIRDMDHPRNISVETHGEQVRLLREHSKVPESKLEKVVKWLDEYHDDQYSPKLYKATDFHTKWDQIADAMERHHPAVEEYIVPKIVVNKIPLTKERAEMCLECEGTGIDPCQPEEECYACDGTGKARDFGGSSGNISDEELLKLSGVDPPEDEYPVTVPWDMRQEGVRSEEQARELL